MELHVKTRGTGLCRLHNTHVIMLHTHAKKDKTNYLGANVSKQGGGGDDIVNIIRKDKVSLMKFKQTWSSNIYILRYKFRLFNTLVKPVLLCGSETWKINEGHNRKLDTFSSAYDESYKLDSHTIYQIKISLQK